MGYQTQFLSPVQRKCCDFNITAKAEVNNAVEIQINFEQSNCPRPDSIELKIRGKCSDGTSIQGPTHNIRNLQNSKFLLDIGEYNCNIIGYEIEYTSYCEGNVSKTGVLSVPPKPNTCCSYKITEELVDNKLVATFSRGGNCIKADKIIITITAYCKCEGGYCPGSILEQHEIRDTDFNQKSFSYALDSLWAQCEPNGVSFFTVDYAIVCGREVQRKRAELYPHTDNCCNDNLIKAYMRRWEPRHNGRIYRFYYRFPYDCAESRFINYVAYNSAPYVVSHEVNSDTGYIDVPISVLQGYYVNNNSFDAELFDCRPSVAFEFIADCPGEDGSIVRKTKIDHIIITNEKICKDNNGCETEATLSKIYPVKVKSIYDTFVSSICGQTFSPSLSWNQQKYNWSLEVEIKTSHYIHTVDANNPYNYNYILIHLTTSNGRTLRFVGKMVNLNTIRGFLDFDGYNEDLRDFACSTDFSLAISYQCKVTGEMKNIDVKIPEGFKPSIYRTGSYKTPFINESLKYEKFLVYSVCPIIERIRLRPSASSYPNASLEVLFSNPYFSCRSYDRNSIMEQKILRISSYGSPEHLSEVRDRHGNNILIKNFLNDPSRVTYTRGFISNRRLKYSTYMDPLLLMDYFNYSISSYEDPYTFPFERLRCLVLKNEGYNPHFTLLPTIGPEVGYLYYTTFMDPSVTVPKGDCTIYNEYKSFYSAGFGFIGFDYVYKDNGLNNAGKFAYDNVYYDKNDSSFHFHLQFLMNYNRVKDSDYYSNANFYSEFYEHEVELLIITEIDTPDGKRMKVDIAQKDYGPHTPQQYKLKEILHLPSDDAIPLGLENEPIRNRKGHFIFYYPDGVQDAIENKRLGFSLRIKDPNFGINAFSLGTVVIFPTKDKFSGINY
jgi:hypothetical protein